MKMENGKDSRIDGKEKQKGRLTAEIKGFYWEEVRRLVQGSVGRE